MTDHPVDTHAAGSHRPPASSLFTIARHALFSPSPANGDAIERSVWIINLICIFIWFVSVVAMFIQHGVSILNVIGFWIGVKGFYTLYTGWVFIPNSPPTVGLITCWGVRQPAMLTEGWHLLDDMFPFVLGKQDIVVKQETMVVTYPTIECLSDTQGTLGGTVSMKLSVTYEPCYHGISAGQHLLDFQNSGGKAGVETIMENKCGEEARHLGIQKTWEEFILEKNKLRLQLETFLRTILGIGVNITQVSIPDLSPVGELALLAESVAIEKRQREAEGMDIDTEIKLAEKYIARDPTMSLKDALANVRINRNRTKEIRVTSDNPLTGAAAVLSSSKEGGH